VLLLFDIDGTLLRGATEAHRAALDAALHEVHGLADTSRARVDPAGRTDGEITREVLLQCGVSSERIEARAADVRAVACEEYARRCPADLSAFVLPGVPDLLESVAERGGVQLALVTGNFEPIGRLKLARAGLGAFFPSGQGGFGSDHEDRTLLPEIARRRAARNGAPYPREETIVIGDTPRDIACAHADRVACLAVATGPHRAEELTAADAVAHDARELAALLDERLPAA
jgi:phosphoglycolate phosphatase-like HAD superfamily hydrolase